jgi:hypothetical protein
MFINHPARDSSARPINTRARAKDTMLNSLFSLDQKRRKRLRDKDSAQPERIDQNLFIWGMASWSCGQTFGCRGRGALDT